MTQDELKLVLEALETPSPMGQYKAITAIKEVLAQPRQKPYAWELDGELYKTQQFHLRGGPYANQIPLYTSPPQRTEQEPVALETLLKWDDDIDNIDPIGEVVGFIEGSPYIMVKVHKGKQVSLDDDLYATPPQRTEQPKVRTGDCLLAGVCASEGHKIQPQRTWVGLTDDEIAQGWKESWVTEQAWQSAVWWAEEKLKEKNT